MKPEPQTEAELLERAHDMAGLSFAELAAEANMIVPENFSPLLLPYLPVSVEFEG